MYVTELSPVMNRTPPCALTLNVFDPVTGSPLTAVFEDSPSNPVFGIA